MRRFWCVETCIFLGLWLVLMLAGRSMLLRDPGTFWHTVVGQRMLDQGAVLDADPFSFTRGGETWIAHQWLSECTMAALYRLGGWDTLLLATAALLAGVYTWLAGRMLRSGLHWLWAGGLLALVLLGSSPQFHIRPLLVTIGGMALLFALLLDIEDGRRSPRWLWLLVPACALWANLHGGVLAGWATAAMAAAGWTVGRWAGRPAPLRQGRDVAELAAVLVLAAAAMLLNPYGLDLPRAWLTTLAMPLPMLIEEHGPLDLTKPFGWATLLLGAGYLATLAGVRPKQWRVAWLLPLLWLVLAIQRVRNAPLFAIMAALAIADILPRTRWAPWLGRREVLLPQVEEEKRHYTPAAALLPALLVGLALAMQLAGAEAPILGRGWARLDPTRWPVDLLPELKQIEADHGSATPIFNDMKFGGFLIFHTPGLRVFIDDRCALYGTELLSAYDQARRERPERLQPWQRRYGFRHALVEPETEFDRYLGASPRWTLVRRGPAAALYRLTTSARGS